MRKYDDIINMPHHQSATRPHMSIHDRAAQFAPFAALTGYGDAISGTSQANDEMMNYQELYDTSDIPDIDSFSK